MVCARYGSCQSEQEPSLTEATGRPARAWVLRPGGGWNSVVGFVPTHQTQALCTGTSICQILKKGNLPFRAFMRGMMLQVFFFGGGGLTYIVF